MAITGHVELGGQPPGDVATEVGGRDQDEIGLVLGGQRGDGVGGGAAGEQLAVRRVGAGVQRGRAVLAEHRGGRLGVRGERHRLDGAARASGPW